jgi:hypothetical protein
MVNPKGEGAKPMAEEKTWSMSYALRKRRDWRKSTKAQYELHNRMNEAIVIVLTTLLVEFDIDTRHVDVAEFQILRAQMKDKLAKFYAADHPWINEGNKP